MNVLEIFKKPTFSEKRKLLEQKKENEEIIKSLYKEIIEWYEKIDKLKTTSTIKENLKKEKQEILDTLKIRKERNNKNLINKSISEFKDSQIDFIITICDEKIESHNDANYIFLEIKEEAEEIYDNMFSNREIKIKEFIEKKIHYLLPA